MPRPNAGPRLVHLSAAEYKRQGYATKVWFIRHYRGGSKIQRSTGTDSLEAAQESLIEFIAEFAPRPSGPRHPHEIAVAEILAIYGEEVAPGTADPSRISYCIDALLGYWAGVQASDVKGATCREYAGERRKRGVAEGTIRRELGCLEAAGRHCNREGYVTSFPLIWKPDAPPPKDRWLTRKEAGALLRAIRAQRRVERYLGALCDDLALLRGPQASRPGSAVGAER